MTKLEDRCALCPELLADGYGKCDHRRCMECVAEEALRRNEITSSLPIHIWAGRLAADLGRMTD